MNYGPPGYYPMMGWGGGWHGFGLMHSVFWYAFLILAAVALVLVIRRHWGSGGGESDSALQILKERYARGEIDREEFLARKRDLS